MREHWSRKCLALLLHQQPFLGFASVLVGSESFTCVEKYRAVEDIRRRRGMAGKAKLKTRFGVWAPQAWGSERDHREVKEREGERVLLQHQQTENS